MLCPTCLFVSFLFCQRKVSTDFFKLDALNVAAVDLIGCYWQIWHGTIVKYTKKIAFFSKYITFQKPKKYNELWFSVYFHLAADFVFCQLIFFFWSVHLMMGLDFNAHNFCVHIWFPTSFCISLNKSISNNNVSMVLTNNQKQSSHHNQPSSLRIPTITRPITYHFNLYLKW